ncbi:RidA family protein [Bremerella alba]|uniref:2-iminobutanoate/2-iminopropanoate deaminase n=1 Tax=Bremerella alba TaxID=980252 RepID=A0A7V9A629_9BACT|nr:RidA family protein [Bremerella alba]MBA2113843.1 2-iminobutanoate/2-iminopropanoate deaminase [Bremerella alba]
MKPFQTIADPNIPTSYLPFSPAVQLGSLVFVSGQASVDSSGNIVTDSFEGEIRRSLENVQRILAATNLTLSDVVQTRNYVGRQEDLAEFNRIYSEYFDEPYPARTTLMGCLGTLLKFEVDVIAVIPDQR